MKIETFKSSIVKTFYTELFSDVLLHSPELTTVKLDRDYILNRIDHEGVRFVSQQLPLLGKAAEISLITMNKLEVPLGFDLFSKSCLPVLMHSFFWMLWDSEGRPRFSRTTWSEPEGRLASYYLMILRQALMAFSKVQDVPCMTTDLDAEQAFINRVMQEPRLTASSQFLGDVK